MCGQTGSGTARERLAERIESLPRRRLLAVLVVCLSCFLLRYYIALNWPVDLDAGYYLYDAKLAMQGQRPLLDYFSRSPVYHYLLGYWMDVFGYSLRSGRTFIVLTQVVTTVFVYLLGRDLFSHRVGVGSGFVFALSPFIAYWGYIIKTEPVILLLGSVATWLVVRDVTERLPYQRILVVLSGGLLGLGHLVRASVLLYGILFLFVYLLAERRSFITLRRVLYSILLLGIGFLLVKAVFAVVYDYPLWLLLVEYRNPLSYLGLISIGGGGGGGSVAPGVPDRYTKLRVVYDFVVMSAYLLVPVGIWTLADVFHDEDNDLFLVVGFVVGILLMGFLLIAGTTPTLGGFHTTNMSGQQSLALAVLLAAGYWLGYWYVIRAGGIQKRGPSDRYPSYGRNILLAFVALVVVFYLIKTRLFVGYFFEIAVPLSILTAVALDRFIGVARESIDEIPVTTVAVILCLVVAGVGSFAVYATPENTTNDRRISVTTVDHVSEYVQYNSEPTAEVFTRQLVFALDSDRRNAMGLSRGFYTYPENPTESELIRYIQRNDVQFIVTSPRTRGVISSSPQLRQCIRDNYEVVRSYEDTTAGLDTEIRILERQEPVDCRSG